MTHFKWFVILSWLSDTIFVVCFSWNFNLSFLCLQRKHMLFTGSLVPFISPDCAVVWFSSLLDGIMLGLPGFYSNCYYFVNQHNYRLGLLWSEPQGHPHFFLCSFFSSLFFFFLSSLWNISKYFNRRSCRERKRLSSCEPENVCSAPSRRFRVWQNTKFYMQIVLLVCFF